MHKNLYLIEQLKVNLFMSFMQRVLSIVGNMLTAVGCTGLALAAFGVFDPQYFAIGISLGIRVIGSVAIAGCLLSAIGYGILDFTKK